MQEGTPEWDAIWLKYQKISEKRNKHFLKKFRFDTVPKNARIADVGCGSGQVLRILKERGYTNLSGFEPEERLFAKDNLGGVIRAGNGLDRKSLKGPYDVVIMIGVLHHLHNLDEIRTCLENIHAILVPGGKYYNVEPWKNIVRTVAIKLCRDTPFGLLHPTLRLERELLRLEETEMTHWLDIEHKVLAIAKEVGFTVVYKSRDLRQRYWILERPKN